MALSLAMWTCLPPLLLAIDWGAGELDLGWTGWLARSLAAVVLNTVASASLAASACLSSMAATPRLSSEDSGFGVVSVLPCLFRLGLPAALPESTCIRVGVAALLEPLLDCKSAHAVPAGLLGRISGGMLWRPAL